MGFIPDDAAPRRAFLSSLAAGGAALAASAVGLATPSSAQAQPLLEGEEPWLAGLTGRHRIVFDVPRLNSGFPLPYAHGWITTMTPTYSLAPGDASALMVLRHLGLPMGVSDAIWERYGLGELLNVLDPATKAPATRNLYFRPRPGDIPFPHASVDRLQASGVTFVVCALAIEVLSGRTTAKAGVSPETAKAEWIAGLLPGVHVAPSGTLALTRAQQAGCAYCFTG